MRVSKTATPEPPEIEEDLEEQADLPANEPEDLEDLPEDEASAPADDEDSEPAEADDEADDQADEPAAKAAPRAPQSPSEEPKADPFSFRADGNEIDVPGAVSAEFGIVIPHEAWKEHIQPHLADRGQWRRKEAEYQRRIDTLAQTHPDVVRARVMGDKIDKLLATPESFAQFYENFEQNKRVFELEVKLAAQEAHISARTQQDTAQRTQQNESQLLGLMEEGMMTGIRHVLTEPEFAASGLSPDELHKSLWNHPLRGSFYFKAQAGDGSGLQAGQLGINLEALRASLRPVAQRQTQGRQDVAKVAKAARKNAAAVARPKTFGAVSGKSSDTPSGEKKEPATKDEWLKSLARAARE